MNRKLIVAIVLLIAVATGFAVYLSQKHRGPETPAIQKPEETATSTEEIDTSGWKICRNEEYGWEIKYPPEWFVYGEGSASKYTPSFIRTTECIGKGVMISSYNVDEDSPTKKSNSINIRIDTPQDLRGTVHEGKTKIEEFFQNASELKEVILDKEKFLDYTPIDEIDTVMLLGIHKQNRVAITGKMPRTLFDAILSTFKFLD